MTRTHCPLCKAVVEPEVLNEINGEEGRLAVSVYGMPVLHCSNGHRFFSHPTFHSCCSTGWTRVERNCRLVQRRARSSRSTSAPSVGSY